jgi:LDH2 family malate/lactate/ureidoglycolate dehydrogenase
VAQVKKTEFSAKESRTVQKTVRLPRCIEAKLQREADIVGISIPAAIVQILERWAKRVKNP